MLVDRVASGIFQFHSLLGITPLEQVQNRDHGNLLVYQGKFNYLYDERQRNPSCTLTMPEV